MDEEVLARVVLRGFCIMSHPAPDPNSDPFKPPAIPTEVQCLHCGREYESYLIEWRIEEDPDGRPQGAWCCPTPGCEGTGFGFDILPTDPEYIGEDGEAMWVFDDEEEEDAAEFDPPPDPLAGDDAGAWLPPPPEEDEEPPPW